MRKDTATSLRRAITSLALAVAATCSVHAKAAPIDDLVEAQKAYERGDEVKSFQSAVKAARAGYVPAFVVVGTHYALGIGTVKDGVKAVFWFQKSASAGDAFGQYQLALAYLKGDGVSEDLGSALRWAQLSANANHPKAADLADHIRDQLGPSGAACVDYGFKLSTLAYSQCVMQLDQIQQQAMFAERQHQLQLAQYQQQVAAYEEQQRAIKKEKDRRKWEAIGRLGAGMANSSSPSFLGALNEGLAAANGYPIAKPPALPPSPPAVQNYTIRGPNGDQIYCSYNTASRYINCR